MNFKFYIDNIRRFNTNAERFLGKGYKLKAFLSELYCAVRYGCSPDDYFRYEFYKKSGTERNKFITYRRSQRIINQYNKPQSRMIFNNKRLFNEKFREFIGREWIDVGKCTKSEFEAFVIRHGEVLIKPLDGGQGKGIYKLTADELDSFNYAEHSNFIAEELLRQHPTMALLNASSVNTVRVLTFKGKVIACALRIGGDNSVVDNLHSNGVCAHLNKEHGIIDAVCIDNAMNKYLFHPSTGIQMIGFQVPNWDKVIETVVKAAQVVPEIEYVGWDVAVLENDIAMIEGNHDPGHDVVQMIAQTGLYGEIRKMEAGWDKN